MVYIFLSAVSFFSLHCVTLLLLLFCVAFFFSVLFTYLGCFVLGLVGTIKKVKLRVDSCVENSLGSRMRITQNPGVYSWAELSSMHTTTLLVTISSIWMNGAHEKWSQNKKKTKQKIYILTHTFKWAETCHTCMNKLTHVYICILYKNVSDTTCDAIVRVTFFFLLCFIYTHTRAVIVLNGIAQYAMHINAIMEF